jgi:hypothetical protein
MGYPTIGPNPPSYTARAAQPRPTAHSRDVIATVASSPLNNDGTYDATTTFCAHAQGLNGAFHTNEDGIWKIDTTSQPIFPGATNQTFWTSTDGGTTWKDTQMPAAPNHYSFKPGPGISAEATVTLIPGR